MALLSSSASSCLHRLLRPPPPQPPPLFPSFLRPLSSLTATPNSLLSKPQKPTKPHHSFLTTQPPISPHSLFFTRSLSTSSLSLQQEEQETEDFDDGSESESEKVNLELEDDGGGGFEVPKQTEKKFQVPSLTVKEKKELCSYANSLGKKLKSQLIGKSGVTDGVASSFVETLEANELLKIKIHNTCPGELEDVIQRLQESTGSVVVGQIGRTVIVYRPSVSKMEAEEKKREARKIYVRKDSKLATLSPVQRKAQVKAQVPSLARRGRRGSSRFEQ